MIPLVDLQAQYHSIKEEIDAAISQVIESGQFILGPNVKALEEEIANYCGTRYAVGVASGTDALHLSLIALGIGDGDEVITTPFTFFATAEAISQTGATPAFVDIDPVTYNIDPARIEGKITSKTRAILPVHLYGQPADMEAILDVARKNNLLVVEDCAQAIGAEFQNKKAGSFGDAGCLSFFPSKNLGAYGDGGMVVTNSEELAEKVRMLRTHGSKKKYYHSLLGFNSRLDEVQAAILGVKLKHLNKWIDARRRHARTYDQLLSSLPIETPHVVEGRTHVYHQYTIESEKRKLIQETLGEAEIASAVYYPLPLHLQEVYKRLGYTPGSSPESEKASGQVLSLPMFPELTNAQIVEIASVIRRVLSP
jgi:dTDP-4-amino-4,6-dideoxygalactose transaminase